MRSVEVIVVGGGPAGSAAAQVLRSGGADVLVIDKESFPRLKLCAGWITPQVLSDIGFSGSSYPHGFVSFQRLHFRSGRLHFKVPCLQHSIRRVEFDAWLLQRSGAEVIRHNVREVANDGEYYLIDGLYRCRYLIGAAGTSCPVRRSLFRADLPRRPALQTVTLELEFPCAWADPDCHLWFFERGLPGYSWYVPKASGWLNIGVGAMAERLSARGVKLREHWLHLVDKLQRDFGITCALEPTGYSYYLRGSVDGLRRGNAFLVGDSAGVATRDLCEGIGPAIRSGQRAAAAILNGVSYQLDDVTGASLGGGVLSRCMDWAFTHDWSGGR